MQREYLSPHTNLQHANGLGNSHRPAFTPYYDNTVLISKITSSRPPSRSKHLADGAAHGGGGGGNRGVAKLATIGRDLDHIYLKFVIGEGPDNKT